MSAYIVSPPQRYAKVVAASRRIRWDIDRDVIRARRFDFTRPFLPAGLALVDELAFLSAMDARLLSQVQGRTYANLLGLFERFIGAKMLDLGSDHVLGDQTAFEALLRFTDEELKHQALFRRIERMLCVAMPAGYRLVADPNAVAAAVLARSAWAVLALACQIELLTQAHYRASIGPECDICLLWKDVFLHHGLEEAQHAVLDELEWQREDSRLDAAQRDAGVDDYIALVRALDGILQAQAAADADWFLAIAAQRYSTQQARRVHAVVLAAYRRQYIVCGAAEPRFRRLLGGLASRAQLERILSALAPVQVRAT